MREILATLPLVVPLAALPALSQPQPAITAHFINVGYLESFFTRRSDLGRTLNAILITHHHADPALCY